MRSIRLFAAIATLAPIALQAQITASWNLPGSCTTTTATGSFGATTVQFSTSGASGGSGVINSVQNAAGTWCTDNSTNVFKKVGTEGSYWTRFGGAASTAYGSFAPTNMSMVQLVGEVGGKITFAQAVIDPWIVVTSVGNTDQNGVGVGVTYTFSDPFLVAANNSSFANRAYWDNWTAGWEPSYTLGTKSITGREFSGVLKFTGTFTQLSFTTTGAENWHGFTVGAQGISTVPEPSTYALMGVGLLALGAVARRRRNA